MNDQTTAQELHRLRRTQNEPTLREVEALRLPARTPQQRLLELREQAALLGWTEQERSVKLP